ncbi:formimidoyltransferase-cyclodeaminase isoform X2 [Acipenser ruthenus]|uniref:formimidoyltransferase-cyclodeaminase isoform X2 n=1 Tax=Acipenser ruthenus TaxID=7906 RepID=UPI00145B3B69|nr:formimidoyltransferase-cyclodeaminase isoform X2 [Acipenser ruthenus]
MSKLVECVPNFSEGRNKEVIDAIATAISSTEGCLLLDVDPGPSTNRTVYTFVGSPEAVLEGALSAARVAFQLIDMTRHTGEHPRMGAMDVCPFIPVQNVSMEECVCCGNRFAQRLAEELGVPVYLYGEAARKENRRSLPSIRAGEYEALPEKLKKPEWAPDFGPSRFVPTWGATVTGARKFLIAYNVNLLSTKEQAHRIALDIREQGRGKEQELNLPVVGSQLVGLIPLKAVLDSAEFYIQKEKLFILEEEHKVRLVINRLGLDSLAPFVPKERIIEYMVESEDESLVSMPLRSFIRSVGARSAAPGGGSVSAAIAAMGAALGAMVGQMTYGKRQYEDLDGIMRRLILPFHQSMNELISLVDADSNAFNSYMAALKLPKTTAEQKERREAMMQEGLKKAVAVPLFLAEKVNSLWPTLKELVLYGNIACKSDIQVAAKALETAVFGAYCNVVINLKDIKDEAFKTATQQEASGMLEEARASVNTVLEAADERKK